MKIIAKKFGSYNLFAVSLQRQNEITKIPQK